MTFVYELDLGIPKMYPHTKNESLDKGLHDRARPGQTDTDRRDRTHYYSRIWDW